MPPTQTTAPSMCSAKASAAMSGRPVRGTIKRYYSGYTLAYASYGKEGIGTLRHFPAQRNLDASGGKADIRRSNGCVGPTRLAHSEHCVASPRTCEEAGLSLTVYELIAQRMV